MIGVDLLLGLDERFTGGLRNSRLRLRLYLGRHWLDRSCSGSRSRGWTWFGVRQRHLVRILLGAVECHGPGSQRGVVATLVLYLQLPGAGWVLTPAEHGQEWPVMEACSGAVVGSPGQELGLGAMR